MLSTPNFYMPNLSRRTLLRAGGLGLLGLNVPGVLRAQSEQTANPKARAKSVIFLFQWGGPSHLDMFDLKPKAPDDIRGPYKPIASACPQIAVGEKLPEMAKRMDKVTLIRSVTHTMMNHNSAGYYALSGHAPPTDDQRLRDSLDLYPSYGSALMQTANYFSLLLAGRVTPLSFIIMAIRSATIWRIIISFIIMAIAFLSLMRSSLAIIIFSSLIIFIMSGSSFIIMPLCY